jgi:hypothetical protein
MEMLLLADFIFVEKGLGVKLLVIVVDKIQRRCLWLFLLGREEEVGC